MPLGTAAPIDHLVIDIGTSSVRVCIVTSAATIEHEHRSELLPSSPFPGAVEFDAGLMAEVVELLCHRVLTEHGPVLSVGITCQRASTVLWDSVTGAPIGPGIGWQDIRTAGMCLVWNAQGFNLAPNQSATKLAFLLDTFDPDRDRSRAGGLRFGTIDTWIAWRLSEGRLHVTDPSNAAVTGLGAIHSVAGIEWDDDRCDALGIPTPLLPRIVDSSEQIGPLTRLPGSPMLCALIGDQQASLVGQGCVSPGVAKMTFGTGAMLDMAVGSSPPLAAKRHAGGTIPIVTWRIDGKATWGVEAIMLSAGTCVEWLRDDMGLIGSAAESEAVAAAVPDTGDVWFVPALLGLATPHWDYGARGTLVGLTRGTERAHVVRAVLEGVAQRGADLVLAAVADSTLPIRTIRVDGGMSRNKVFAQALADATALPVEISPQTEATALGAGFLAGLPTGSWPDLASIGKTWSPITVYTPQFAHGSERHTANRKRWADAVRRSEGWFPDLSALDF